MREVGALPYAHGGPPVRAVLRALPEDFFVDEDLGFAPEGAGEHAFVRVEKRGANTDWVAQQLARFAGVDAGAVSYAGLKDRHAVARQTFSVHLPGRPDPDWSALTCAEFRVLSSTRHRRKLQRGALNGNHFRIVLRDANGDVAAVEQRLAAIRHYGVPNYFGEQRFGRDHGNLDLARAMFAGKRVRRHERSLLLSAARSHLFNEVLAERVRRGDWNRPLDGDVWMLAGSESIFGPEPVSDALRERIERGDIAPTGPLCGAGELRTRDTAAQIEIDVADRHDDLVGGLCSSGLRQERRALVLHPDGLDATWLSPREFCMRFSLRKGSYATVLLREIFDVSAD